MQKGRRHVPGDARKIERPPGPNQRFEAPRNGLLRSGGESRKASPEAGVVSSRGGSTGQVARATSAASAVSSGSADTIKAITRVFYNNGRLTSVEQPRPQNLRRTKHDMRRRERRSGIER
jgi:hypothetical protein